MKLIARLGRSESAPAVYRLPLAHFCSLADARLARPCQVARMSAVIRERAAKKAGEVKGGTSM